MVRDMDVEIRIAVFNALGKIQTVSKDILLQTLSKKALAATKEKIYPGQYTAKLFKIPATAAAFTFVHGLEDEFYQVMCYCFNHSIWMPPLHCLIRMRFHECGYHASKIVSSLLSLHPSITIPCMIF